MTYSSTPAQTAYVRTFIIEGRARADHEPSYQPCWRMGAQDWSLGDVTKIECPDPDNYGKFVEVGQIQGAVDRPTTDLQGHLSADEESDMLRLSKERCSHDVHAHMGACSDPRLFNVFTKAIVHLNARITNYSSDEVGTLASDGSSEVNETAALSAETIIELLPLAYAARGGDAVVNPLVDVVICDTASCGDCDEESDGCEHIYAVDDGATGSPGTPPDVVYSVNKGATFAAEDVNSLENGEAATGIACLDVYVVVISNVDGGLHYKEKSLIGDGATNWTRVAMTVGGEPNDIWSVGNYAFIVGDGGYVHGSSDPTVAPTVLDAGIATDEVLAAVHAISDQFAVAVGAAGVVIFTENQTTWTAATAINAGAADNLCVWIINEDEWWVGDNAGQLWYTLDKGVSWTQKVLPGTLWTEVQDIQFPSTTNGFIVADKSVAGVGYILESYDGGYSWSVQPQTGAMPTASSLVALATCIHDLNFVVAVGANATDGVIIVGED